MISFFLVCKVHEPFRCNDTKKCIDIDCTCDGVEDCENGFDESFCPEFDNETTTAAQTIGTGVTGIDETLL